MKSFSPWFANRNLSFSRFQVLRTLPKKLIKYVSKQLIHIVSCIDVDLQVPETQQEFQMHRNQACSHQPAGTYICCLWRSWWSWTGIKHFSVKEILSMTLDTNHQPSRAASSLLLTGNVWSQKRPARHWHYPCSDSGGVINCWLLLKDLLQSEPFLSI